MNNKEQTKLVENYMEGVMDRSSTLLISTNKICGYNLVVECNASDLVARVRFSLPAPIN